MGDYTRKNLASIGDIAAVQTCSCCRDKILHINFYNTTLRMTKEHFRYYTAMLNEAMLMIDESGEILRELEGIYHFYSFFSSRGNTEENNS
jgi:hypothetical protein